MRKQSSSNCEHGEQCACAIGNRHFWFEAYCELKDKMDKSPEDSSKIADAIERLCENVSVKFNIYDLAGSVNRANDKIKKRRALTQRTISATEEW